MSEIPLVVVPQIAELIRRIVVVYGYGQSVVQEMPVDGAGSPIPWYTYPMIEYLDSFDHSDRRVFEYGCGNSTAWWAARAREVISVEHSPEWYGKMLTQVPANSKLLLREDATSFARAIRDFDHFDVIVVDGEIARYESCIEAIEHLNPGGVIILDNSDCLPNCTHFLRSSGLFEVAMNGFTPLLSRASRTSIFLTTPSRLVHGPHRSALAGTTDRWDKLDGPSDRTAAAPIATS